MKTTMQKEELLRRHPYHEMFGATWETYLKMKQSGEELVKHAIYQQPRETEKNFRARLRDAVVFNFAKTVIDIFSFYMGEKETVYAMPGLENDTQWELFKDDADLQGTNYDVLMNEAQKYASYFGAVGLLVNKPYSDGSSLQTEIDNGIYPYYTMYSLQNIFDWKYIKNPLTHRKQLVYLKLYEEDGTWTIWTPDTWQQWEIHPKRGIAVLVAQGVNPLGEIPFTWMLNIRNMEYPELGQSDIVDISRIVLSIAQNMSSADEIIKYAGFPIMRTPMKKQDLLSPQVEGAIETGPTAVAEFDPSLGSDGKPDWMPTQIKEPLDAIMNVILTKANEIYRIAYLSGIHGQRKSSNESTSGLALRYELSQLKSVMTSKSTNKIEAELTCFYYWLKWKNMQSLFSGFEVKQSKEFSIDELAVTLDNAIIAYKAVLSKTFREEVQKKIASRTLPDLPQETKTKIIAEIKENTPQECTFDVDITNRALVKSASQAANQADDQAANANGKSNEKE
jgi:hypothetical protein